MNSVTIDIAGIGFRFLGDDAALALVRERYRPFLCDAVGDATEFELEVGTEVIPPSELVETTIRVVSEGDPIVLQGAGIVAEASCSFSKVRLRAPMAERAIDAVLRFVLASRLLDRGGLLLHASVVVIDGAAWVFTGPSGIGKSTLGKRLSGTLLCDEAVAVLPTGAGAGAVAHATPFWNPTPGTAPVAAILFPQRGERPEWRKMSPAQATARLAGQTGPTLPSATAQVLEAAADIRRRARCSTVVLPTIRDIETWLQPQLRSALKLADPA